MNAIFDLVDVPNDDATALNSNNKLTPRSLIWFVGPGVIKQLLDELEKSVKALEDRYAEKVKAYGVRHLASLIDWFVSIIISIFKIDGFWRR